MKVYTREDFIKLPAGTIYSRINTDAHEIMWGLFCKTSGPEYEVDWVEQDLIDSPATPDEIDDCATAYMVVLDQRDQGEVFRLDYESTQRDGMFEPTDRFVVWDDTDVAKLETFLANRFIDHR